MRLADFIEKNIALIVEEAKTFAKTLGEAGARLDDKALRDHIPDMLNTIIADLRTEQSDAVAQEKAEGDFAPDTSRKDSAAQIHACERADQGFDVIQLVSEYRVLRATVVRLWTPERVFDEEAVEDMNRFNEAVDQAVAESVGSFSNKVEQWRDVFLGILGHELRGPLSSILLAAEMMGTSEASGSPSKHLVRIVDSGNRMQVLLNDLLDFNRVSYGLGLIVDRALVDLAPACMSEIEIARTNWPGREFDFTSHGSCIGEFDASRVREVVGNLLTNAVKYGDRESAIAVHLDGRDDLVCITVKNSGPEIPEDKFEELFEPLRRGTAVNGSDGSLGLGLFIVKQVALAHGGSVAVSSSGGVTEFCVRLRRADMPPVATTDLLGAARGG